MATVRLKYLRIDENLRIPGLEARNFLRAPQFEKPSGAFKMLEGVHMTLNEQTGIIDVVRGDSDVYTFHVSRAWFVIRYKPEDVKLVDEEIARHNAARAAADTARADASTHGKKVA